MTKLMVGFRIIPLIVRPMTPGCSLYGVRCIQQGTILS